jgi:hypothetical protein
MLQTPPPPTSSGERFAAAGIVALVLATVLLGALLPNRAAPPPRSVADDPGCLEWTDGCRVCQRLAEGPACSLPGIACEPGAPRCLRHRDG